MATPHTSYNPGDWPDTLAQKAANELAFTEGEGQEYSSAVQVPEAAQAALDISGDARRWAGEVAQDAIAAPSVLSPDIQGKQKSATPYVERHLYP
jgi:hypothetical protein